MDLIQTLFTPIPRHYRSQREPVRSSRGRFPVAVCQSLQLLPKFRDAISGAADSEQKLRRKESEVVPHLPSEFRCESGIVSSGRRFVAGGKPSEQRECSGTWNDSLPITASSLSRMPRLREPRLCRVVRASAGRSDVQRPAGSRIGPAGASRNLSRCGSLLSAVCTRRSWQNGDCKCISLRIGRKLWQSGLRQIARFPLGYTRGSNGGVGAVN